jgi:hypothetical protein
MAKLLLVARCNDGSATLDELETLYDHDREITYQTFARHVDIPEISMELGYAFGRHSKGLRLRKDWHVRYYRSKFRGQVCYHLDWSAIDHIFQ